MFRDVKYIVSIQLDKDKQSMVLDSNGALIGASKANIEGLGELVRNKLDEGLENLQEVIAKEVKKAVVGKASGLASVGRTTRQHT